MNIEKHIEGGQAALGLDLANEKVRHPHNLFVWLNELSTSCALTPVFNRLQSIAFLFIYLKKLFTNAPADIRQHFFPYRTVLAPLHKSYQIRETDSCKKTTL